MIQRQILCAALGGWMAAGPAEAKPVVHTPRAVLSACGMESKTYVKIVQRQTVTYADAHWIEICETLRRAEFAQIGRLLRRSTGVFVPGRFDQVRRRLEKLGVRRSLRVIDVAPAILDDPRTQLTQKVSALRALKFKHPARVIDRFPHVLNLDVDTDVKQKIKDLGALGFARPVALIENAPALLGLSTRDSIAPKLDDLRALGFRDVIGMVETFGKLLYLNVADNVEPKLNALVEMGFADPRAVIERFPSLTGLDLDQNIRPTIEFLRRDWGLTLAEIERAPMLIGASIARAGELRDYLVERRVDVKQMSFTLKSKLIKTISAADVENNLKRGRFFGINTQARVLGDPAGWPTYLRKSSCAKNLAEARSTDPA